MPKPLSHSTRLFVLQSKIAGWLRSGAPSDSAVIDGRVIEGLRKLPQTDGRDLVSDLIQVFFTSTQLRFKVMETALGEADWGAFGRAAHSLRSSAANLGAHSMSALAEKLEKLQTGSFSSEAPGLLSELKNTFLRVRKELEVELKEGLSVSRGQEDSAQVPARMGRILLVEDSPDDQLLIERSLQSRFKVICAENEAQVLEAADHEKFDLLLLDVMLPDTNGFVLYGKLKNHPKLRDVPAIFITAQASIEDKLRGFGLGAHDYVVKPFEPMELLARIEARIVSQPEETVEFSGIRLNIPLQRASIPGSEPESRKELELTPIEFKLLYHFVRHPEQVYSRDQLLDQVWGSKVYVLGRTIDKHVCSLRQKLESSAHFLKTVPGQGYRFSSRD